VIKIREHSRPCTSDRKAFSWARLITITLTWWCMALPAANAQNLLTNSRFNDLLELAGWEVFQGRAEWSDRDINNSNRSGSARGMHLLPGNNGSLLVLRQCVETDVAGKYRFGAWTFAESGQGGGSFGGTAWVLAFSDNDDCTGDPVDEAWSPVVTIRDQWVLTEGVLEAPEGVRSILLRFHIFKANGVEHDAIVYFDNAFLRSDRIHSDRFESP
jgi:hypothetical protein